MDLLTQYVPPKCAKGLEMFILGTARLRAKTPAYRGEALRRAGM